jgi:thiol-disulfide isomerase/thioredoxin
MKTVFIAILCSFGLLPLLVAGQESTLRKAPELAFNVPGQGQELLSSERGKVIALEFIETTCPHCQAWAPKMAKLQSEFGSRGFQVIEVAVNALDEGGTPQSANQVVANFARTYNLNFPVGWVTKSQMAAFMGYTESRFVVPQLVLIDRKGYIREETPQLGDGDYEQIMNEASLRQKIEELLGGSARRSR